MSNNVKTRFAGILRGLLRRFDDEEAEAPAPEPSSAPAAHPAPPAARVAAAEPAAPDMPETVREEPQPQRQIVSKPAPAAPAQPAPVQTAPNAFVQATPAGRPQPRAETINEIELSLPIILEKLPLELRSKMTMRIEDLGSANMTISVEQILPQLAAGAVKITFGQLRQAAPELFKVAEQYDSLTVPLPLNLVLSKLSPGMLPRNVAQKSVVVPSEIGDAFNPGMAGVTVTKTPLKPAAPAQTRINPAQPQPYNKPYSPPQLPSQRVTTPSSPLQRPAAPSSQRPAAPPAPSRPSAPIPAPNLPPPSSFTRVAPTPTPVAPAPPVRTAAAPMAPAAARPQSISVSLTALAERWPAPLQQEIQRQNLAGANVELPFESLEKGLKRGRVVFSWRDLRTKMKPSSPGTSANDGIELELPLKVVVPIFIEVCPPSRPPLRVSVDRSIPNLFFGFPSPEMEAPVTAPVAEAPPEPAPPAARPAIKPVDAKLADTNYYVWGDTSDTPRVDATEYKRAKAPATDFTKRFATPKEVVERAMAIPGVAGAVIALPDGLKVASQVPPELNADTVAAFLPQIFDRVGQSTKELRMGPLNNLKFTVGNVPWKIFRVNAVYFAAFGRAGERLPTAQLVALAAELDRKPQ